jgi:hypothetical protein
MRYLAATIPEKRCYLMAFFGLSKSKQEREADDARLKEREQKAARVLMFPNGKADALRDCQRINLLTHSKISSNKLFDFVADCKCLIFLHADISERQEAYDVYVYLEGEARFYDDSARRKLKGTGASLTTSEAGERLAVELRPFLAIYAAGVNADEIPTGFGEFGFDVNNPIPTISVSGSERYLRRLRYDGHPITSQLVGSPLSKVTPGPIDNYMLSVGDKKVGSIFICAWHKRNSRKAPRGFTLLD